MHQFLRVLPQTDRLEVPTAQGFASARKCTKGFSMFFCSSTSMDELEVSTVEPVDSLPVEDPFRLLALHVLKQAIADKDRFFFRRENPMLSFWCSLARLSAAGLSEKISKKLSKPHSAKKTVRTFCSRS